MIVIKHANFQHEGGTKFYSISLIGRGISYVMIKRWGKIGATGSMKVEPVSSNTCDVMFNRERRRRESKGYLETTAESRKINNVEGGELFNVCEEISNIVGRNPFDVSEVLKSMANEEVREYSIEHDDEGLPLPVPKKTSSNSNEIWGIW